MKKELKGTEKDKESSLMIANAWKGKGIVFDVVQPHLSRPSSSSLLLYLETTSSAVVFGDVAFRNSMQDSLLWASMTILLVCHTH